MTFATQLTVFRILLIPVFVLLAAYYGAGLAEGSPVEALRYAAIGVFILASLTDALDGWVARRFNQASALGAMLDPIADKGLLLSAVITLSLANFGLPIWFPVLVIARDIVIVIGCFIVRHFSESLEIAPSWLGKCATAFQMIAIAWVMLRIPNPDPIIWAAGGFTVMSGIDYLVRGLRLLANHESSSPRP